MNPPVKILHGGEVGTSRLLRLSVPDYRDPDSNVAIAGGTAAEAYLPLMASELQSMAGSCWRCWLCAWVTVAECLDPAQPARSARWREVLE